MRRLAPLLALLTLTPATAQTPSGQATLLPYVTLSAPGYTVRAEVRPAVTDLANGPYFQFSPAQVRVVLNRVGQNKWQAQYATDMPPAYVTVTPVQNWRTLFTDKNTAGIVHKQLDNLQAINAGKMSLSTLQKTSSLPYLPLTSTVQAITGAVRKVNTPQLQGVRYLAIYAETSAEYPRSAVFYTFQGLSRDGKYVVSVRLPYAPASFPQEVRNVTTVQPAQWLRYHARASSRLDAETANLAAFDRLVQSIRIR